ncbi:uncharacterized protein BO87DRAFT_423402 [Aspergillus neoniger CBS 115656]|uniref:Uncharacterized protein n=1 Tax=Aspergillus neoniger (strain CBS 115656) TaxID=1448310 RepID=A0A318YRL0_ASPNB|nr:hypothetical protein BO87DRAFT_423402 [Aspergillus neoniger CBS 115656]PYH37079.1 hypothetical protein BO87DRAFT_423402 [Aspergillus neoniger CBS 115656]
MSMKRSFHSARAALIRFWGFPAENLEPPFHDAFFTYVNNGAVKKVGEIESVEILHRNDGSNPIHKSHFNRNDPANIISARIKPKNGSARTHHIYENGTGTMHVPSGPLLQTSGVVGT